MHFFLVIFLVFIWLKNKIIFVIVVQVFFMEDLKMK